MSPEASARARVPASQIKKQSGQGLPPGRAAQRYTAAASTARGEPDRSSGTYQFTSLPTYLLL
jgi:hypothetical protein